MEGYSRKEGDVNHHPQLLDLISPVNGGEWLLLKQKQNTSLSLSQDNKNGLELSLAPPGGHDEQEEYFQTTNQFPYSLQKLPTAVKKEPSQTGNTRVLESERKPLVTTAGSAHKRTAPGPVVGWPPVRSFRKNFTTGSSLKSASVSPDKSPNQKPADICTRGMFVKINMDGIPIGRKVDLKACDSYIKLSHAVDELFRGLIAAQNDTSDDGMNDKEDEGKKVIGGLLDGSGEYTLVYEDNEGDRMLVGDVPWHMFISTVKRLRVLKSSELPTLSRGNKQGKLSSGLT